MSNLLEVKLEALDAVNPDNNTYIAVRVGENQKLSRLSATRHFKFPQSAVGNRRFGKVDIFKRVGSASIGITPDTANTVQEIAIEPSDQPGSKINLRATIAGEGTIPSDKPAGKDLSNSVLEAKGYLLEHNLEMILADAMQAVLRERPANPTQFISEKLKLSEGTYTKGPARAQTAPEGATRPGQPAPEPKAAEADPFPAATTEEAAPAPAVGDSTAKASQMAVADFNTDDAAAAPAADAAAAAAPEVPDAAKVAPDATAELRAQAKAILVDATSTGKLDEALAKMKKNGEAEPAAAAEATPAPEAAEPAAEAAPVATEAAAEKLAAYNKAFAECEARAAAAEKAAAHNKAFAEGCEARAAAAEEAAETASLATTVPVETSAAQDAEHFASLPTRLALAAALDDALASGELAKAAASVANQRPLPFADLRTRLANRLDAALASGELNEAVLRVAEELQKNLKI